MPVTINGDGSITGLSVGGLGSGVVNTATIADGAVTNLKQGPGSVIQVKSAVKTDTSEQNSDTFSNIPSLSVSITASASTSKFYVICSVTGTSNNQLRLRLARDGSAIGVGVASGNRDGIGAIIQKSNSSDYGFQAATMQVLTGAIGDTSAHTFTAQYAKETGGGAGYIGRNVNDLNNDSGFRASSHITVMEISA